MNPFSFIGPLLQLLATWLQLRAAAEKFRLQQEIQTYVDNTQDQDAKLRASGNADDVARADIMRDRAAAAAGILSGLPDLVSAPNATASKGSASSK